MPERQRMRSRGGDVVVEAESHRPIALGVMAGRPHQRQHARRARLNDRFDPANRRRRRPAARRRAMSGDVYVSGSSDAARPAVSSIAARCAVAVHPPQLGVRRRARRLHDAPALLPCGGDAVHHLGPLDTLGMAGRRPVIAETIGVNED